MSISIFKIHEFGLQNASPKYGLTYLFKFQRDTLHRMLFSKNLNI